MTLKTATKDGPKPVKPLRFMQFYGQKCFYCTHVDFSDKISLIEHSTGLQLGSGANQGIALRTPRKKVQLAATHLNKTPEALLAARIAELVASGGRVNE